MQPKIHSAPEIVYPESDGKPIAETDLHRDLMFDFIKMHTHYYKNRNDVYVSGNLLIYYEEGSTKKSVAPDVFVVFGVSKKSRRTYLTWEEGQTPDLCWEWQVLVRITVILDLKRTFISLCFQLRNITSLTLMVRSIQVLSDIV